MINVYEQLADCSRRRILGELRSGPKRVSDLVNSLNLKQPNVSNHLAKLRDKDLVTSEKVGREVYYRFANPEIRAVIEAALARSATASTCEDLSSLTQALAEAALEGNDAAALDVVDQLLFASLPPLEIYENVVGQVMGIVGKLYLSGEIDEGKEHLASEVMQRVLTRIALATCPSKWLGYRALLGCAPGSFHTLGLRVVGDFLRSRGWSTRFLGANVPIEAFLRAVKDYEPNVVLISCCAEEATLANIRLLRELSQQKGEFGFVLGVGGPAATLKSVEFTAAGADFVASSLSEFSRLHLTQIEKPERTLKSAPA